MQTTHFQTDCHVNADHVPGFNPAGIIVLNFGMSPLAGMAAALLGASPLAIALAASLGGSALTLAVIFFAVNRKRVVANALKTLPHNDGRALS